MDIKDYNSRLNTARNRYNESAQELKDNYNQRVEDLEDLHSARETNQRRNYINQKLDREAEAENRLRDYDKTLKKSLEERTSRYMKEVGEQREHFEKDRKMQMDDYNQKLSKISKSFDTATKEKEKLHALYKDNIDERYETGLENREKHFNSSLAKVQKSSEKKINEFRDQQNLEKREMITGFENEKKQLVQDANIARNKANSSHQLEMERLRENARQKEDTLRNNFESSNANLRKNKDAENEQQRDTFEKLTADIQERNVAALKKLNRQNKTEKRELEKSFSQDRIELERKTNKILSEGSNQTVDKSVNRMKKRYDMRIDQLQEQMEDNNYQNALHNQKNADAQKDEIAQIEVRHRTEIDGKENEMRRLRENELGELKEKVEKYQESMNKRYTSLELEKEQDSIASRQKLKNSLSRQRAEFGRTINQINDSNSMVITDLRDEMTKEQSKFIENTKEKIHDELADLKNDYEGKIEKTQDSLSQQIELKNKENESLTRMYESKLDTLRAKSAKELESLKKLEHDRREEDKRESQRALNAQSREFQKNLMAMRTEFERKLDRSKGNADLHVAKLTERYESQIETERSEHAKELQRQNMMLTSEFNRLRDQSKIEKNAIINQYEMKINKLREANRVAQEVRNSRLSSES